MHIEVVTLFPDLIATAVRVGVTGRAIERGQVIVGTTNPRDFAIDAHKTVDDRPYGGGPGMVMKVEPARTAIRAAKAKLPDGCPIIYLAADGAPLTHAKVAELAGMPGMLLLAGRYEGVDERLIEGECSERISIGDYVLSGGELPALVVIDAVLRLLPGVLGDEASAGQDSFSTGLLDWPHYTRPENVDGHPVPSVLLSGDHAAVRRWRLKQALGRTWLWRRDLLEERTLSHEERQLLDEFMAEWPANAR